MSEPGSARGRGLVFNIQRYSLHDGPGIRTNVFLKGCPLRCTWCCNPESQDFGPQLAFFPDKCINCGRCIGLCPYGAVSAGTDKPLTDWSICVEKCQGGKEGAFGCTAKCYSKAREVQGREMSVDEVMREVMKDSHVYLESGGGITLTGGEPLSQAGFARDLAREARENYLEVAIETCGLVPWKAYEEILPYLDAIFIDIKFLDAAKHRTHTGQGNELILANAVKLAQSMAVKGGTIIVRTPVIPGLTDLAEVTAIARFVQQEMPGATAMEVLPYHRLGRGKYRDIGREYELLDINPPSEKDMKPFRAIVADFALDGVHA